MKVRSIKARAVIALPVVAVAVLGLSACDTKVGAAAVVNGQRVSEQTLNKYLTPNAQPIPGSTGGSTPARQFVLTALVRIQVFQRLLDVTGGQPSNTDLAAAKATLLQGGSEQELTQSVAKTGLDASFAQAYLRQLELLAVLQTRFKSNSDVAAAEQKADLHVSISPRYGTWDATALSLVGLSKKQLAPLLTLDGPLPGDATSSSSPASGQ